MDCARIRKRNANEDFLDSSIFTCEIRATPRKKSTETMLALLIFVLAACVLSEARNTTNVCCAELTEEGNTACLSNVPPQLCTTPKSIPDMNHVDCCRTEMFACTHFFVLVNGERVESTCENK